MWSAIWAIIMALAKGLGAYFVYKFDPVQIARRDEINRKAALEYGHEKINKALAGTNVLGLSFFISEFLRTRSHSTPGWASDLITRSLPKPRDQQAKDQDTEEGPDIGE